MPQYPWHWTEQSSPAQAWAHLIWTLPQQNVLSRPPVSRPSANVAARMTQVTITNLMLTTPHTAVLSYIYTATTLESLTGLIMPLYDQINVRYHIEIPHYSQCKKFTLIELLIC